MPVPSSIDDLSTTASSNSPAGTEQVFPLNNDYIQTAFAFIALLRDKSGGVLSMVSGTDTITATLASCSAYVAGSVFLLTPMGANAGTSVTLNINSLGAKAVNFNGAALVANFLSAVPVILIYDGTKFNIVNPLNMVDTLRAQTIGGAKTFAVAPSSSVAATLAAHLMRKQESDAALAAAVGRAGYTYTASDWAYLDKAANLIVQWGYVSIPGFGGVQWTFPTPFAGSPFHCGGTANGLIPESVCAVNQNNLKCDYDFASTTYASGAFVFAIGIKAP